MPEFEGLAQQAEQVRAGEVSSAELVAATLDRIAAVDPRLHAFSLVAGDRALDEARAADAARAAGGPLGPLHGVPVAVKDDLDVAGEVTAYGTSASGAAPAAADAEAVRRLRAAGAVVVGRTAVPELMIVPFTDGPPPTRNPWDPERSAGGSSGGSGAAVAAGLVPAALGSDGAGSIRVPAAFCGVYGLKPQRGRVPTAPRDEVWHGLSVIGPISRSVADAALLLDVLAGTGTRFADAAATRPARLRVAVSTAVPRGVVARVGAEQRRAVEGTADLLRSLGHAVVARDPDYGTAAGRVVARYLRGIADAAAELPHPERLSPRTRGYVRLGRAVPPALLARARAGEAADAARLGALWTGPGAADVLLTPTVTGPPFRVGDFDGRGALRTLLGTAARVPHLGAANHTGQPAAAVPAGFDAAGLPLSVQLVGRAGDEATLLSLSAELEAARPWADREPPVSW